MWNENSIDDVTSLCSMIVGQQGSILEVSHQYRFKTIYGEILSIDKSTIQKLIQKDKKNRDYKGDKVLLLSKDSDYLKMPLTVLKLFQDKGYKLLSPSKILAPVSGIEYQSETFEPWGYGHDRTLETTDGISIGSPVKGMPLLVLDAEQLVENRDEEYLTELKEASLLYVVDEFSKFLLEMEGLEAKVWEI